MAKPQEIREQIQALENDLVSAKKQEQYDDASKDLRGFYLSLVNAGFSETEAWEILMTALQNFKK